jgi:hypothetical protein
VPSRSSPRGRARTAERPAIGDPSNVPSVRKQPGPEVAGPTLFGRRREVVGDPDGRPRTAVRARHPTQDKDRRRHVLGRSLFSRPRLRGTGLADRPAHGRRTVYCATPSGYAGVRQRLESSPQRDRQAGGAPTLGMGGTIDAWPLVESQYSRVLRVTSPPARI